VERFHRTVDEEFYYRNFFLTIEDVQEESNRYIKSLIFSNMRSFSACYNSTRSHIGINGLMPEERLKERDIIRVIKKDSKNDFDISFYFNKIKEGNVEHEIFGSHPI
jgi:hypothetical protein